MEVSFLGPAMPWLSLCLASTILECWRSGKEMEGASFQDVVFKPWHFGTEMGKLTFEKTQSLPGSLCYRSAEQLSPVSLLCESRLAEVSGSLGVQRSL